MPERRNSFSVSDTEKQQTPTTDTTVEEVKFFVRRLRRRWPDLCADCRSVIRETLS
jgi:hypothetical protein